jgi:oxygen-dependent protoporphyrinogen oxidase
MIVIIGAGISGLSAAWHLQKAGVEYCLLESSSHPGGYLQTIHQNNCILEVGPNSILCDREILDFIKEVGAGEELVEASQVSKSRFVLKNGKYQKLPDSPPALIKSKFFSWKTKFKIFTEPFRRASQIEQESLDHFFTRRFGKEISDYALNPFVTGIYAGDPKDLLLEETFPSIKEYETKYGSVLKGFIKNKPERRGSYNFKQGMASLPKSIAAGLKSISYGHKVTDIIKESNQFIIKGKKENNESFELTASQLIITIPAFSTSELIKEIYPSLSEALKKVYYPPMAAVHSIYDKKNIHYPIDGFGALNPAIENQFSSGCIWVSSIFPYKAPADKFLFTSFVGGTLNAAKTSLPEEELKVKVHQELSRHFEIKGQPDFQVVVKWKQAIPQYNKEIKKVKELISEKELNNLYFCCNWLNGVSISDCIKKGKQVADKIINLQHP